MTQDGFHDIYQQMGFNMNIAIGLKRNMTL